MSKLEKDIRDVLIVGGGTAGSTAALWAARAGVTTLLVEMRPLDEVGTKACGGAISDDALTTIGESIERPRRTEIASTISGGRLESQCGGSVELSEPGVILNRAVFGQRLVADAIEAGAEFLDATTCVGWADRAAQVVRLRDHEERERDITARVVIDASGYRSVLTRHGGPTHLDTPSRSEVGIGHYALVPLAQELEHPDRARVHLSPVGAADGYGWLFPIGARMANVGLGGTLERVDRPIHSHLSTLLEGWDDVRALPPLRSGTGMLPLRRPLASVVGPGFLTVGDAACHANPLHGGGIAPSIIAGALAGRIGGRAALRRDASVTELWAYAVETMHTIGAPHAVQDILRRLVASLSPDDLGFLAGELALGGAAYRELYGSSPGRFIRHLMAIIGRAARRPALVTGLLSASRQAAAVHRLYRGYPTDPDRLDAWLRRAGQPFGSSERIRRQ
jgi:digeranylgeranylglycerophospholipid reductase